MHSLEEAREAILTELAPMASESVLLAQSAGRVMAVDVTASVNLPRFDNSAMDGYAVIAAEAGSGAQLQWSGEVPAGSALRMPCNLDSVCGFLPDPHAVGANAVVMQEDTRGGGSRGNHRGRETLSSTFGCAVRM